MKSTMPISGKLLIFMQQVRAILNSALFGRLVNGKELVNLYSIIANETSNSIYKITRQFHLVAIELLGKNIVDVLWQFGII